MCKYLGLLAKPPKILTKILSKWTKIVFTLILFGVKYKQTVTLTTFTLLTLEKHFTAFKSAYFSQNFAYLLAYWFLASNTSNANTEMWWA